MNKRTQSFLVLGILILLLPISVFSQEQGGQQDVTLSDLRNQAIQRAVKQCEQSVIRLELFSNDRKLPSAGTGVLIDKGLLVTSSYFVQGDSKVIANFGKKKIPAKVIGRDHSRNICLLQLSETVNARVLEQKKSSPRAGESVIAVGRAISPITTNVSVGIISGKNRIRGRALQTDAKISPTNYGGPLINLKGEVLGIITAISPQSFSADSGFEWYDSGIGFAIPMSDVAVAIDRMKLEGDVHPGVLGISFRINNDFRSPLVVSHCFPRSPAHAAGIRTNDLVTRVNNRVVTNLNDFKNITGRMYAGDSVNIQVNRKNEVKVFTLGLVKELTRYQFPYLGLMVTTKENDGGALIDQVDKYGPMNGMVNPGDLLLEINQIKIQNESELRSALAQVEADQELTAKASRNGTIIELKLTAGQLAKELRPDSFEWQKVKTELAIERTPIRLTGFGNQCRLLWPKGSKETIENLILVLGNSKNEKSPEIKNFEGFANSKQNAVLVVYPESILGWKPEETEAIRQATQKARSFLPNIDKTTIIARTVSGSVACQLIHFDRDKISGVAFIRPPTDRNWAIPMADPGNALHTLVLPDRLNMRNGLNLAQSIKANGLPVRMLSPESDFGKLVDYLNEWIWLSRRL